MNPITFACPQCSQRLAVAPESAGRAVTCPHCQRAVSAPMPVAGAADQGPDFTETLRKAREATDSIFNDQDDDEDSLFGGIDPQRKPIVPPMIPGSTTPPKSDPSQRTVCIPGLPDFPPIRNGVHTPTATRTTYVPTPVELPAPVLGNPFADLSADPLSEASDDLPSSEELDDDGFEEPEAPAFPWKNAVIAALALYAILATGAATWGWLRTPDAAKGTPPAAATKH